MRFFTVILTEDQLRFANELVQSKLAVTIDNVEVVAGFKNAIISAKLIEDEPDKVPK